MENLSKGQEYERIKKLARRRILGYGADPESITFGRARVIHGPVRSVNTIPATEIWAEFTAHGEKTERWQKI